MDRRDTKTCGRATRWIAGCVVFAQGCVAPDEASPHGCEQGAPPWTAHARDVALPAATSTRDAFALLPGAHARSEVITLSENAMAWATRWALVSRARRIELGTFIFEGDVFGRALLGRLLERAREGARVRVLVDGRGSVGLATPFLGRDDLEELAAVGAEVRVYNPPWRGLVGALVALDAVAMSAGSHNKILILDDGEGAVAIVGGRNVSRHSFVALAEDPGAVRDADVLVDGAVAAAAAAALAREFDAAGNDEIVADRWNLRSPRDELVLLARAMDAWLFGAAPAVRPGADDVEVDGAARALLTVATRSLDHAIDDTTSARVRGQLHALVRSRSVWGALAGPLTATTAQPSPGPRIDAEVALVSSPSRAQRAANDNQPLQAWLIALAGARDSVVLESPSFILSPALLLAMQAASARGVDITVLTNSPLSSDSRIAQALFVDSWPELLARVPRLRLFVAQVPQMQHAKRAVFDDALSFIGTFNLDPFSAQMNSETIVAVWSPAIASQVRAELAARLAQMVEYRIARGHDGSARRHPPGTARSGEVVVDFGPRDHVDASELARVAQVKALLLSVRSWYDFDVVVW